MPRMGDWRSAGSRRRLRSAPAHPRSTAAMLRILVAATLIMLVMVVVKDRRLLQQARLLSSCVSITRPPGQTGYRHACGGGRLDGPRALSRQACKSRTMADNVEYWR